MYTLSSGGCLSCLLLVLLSVWLTLATTGDFIRCNMLRAVGECANDLMWTAENAVGLFLISADTAVGGRLPLTEAQTEGRSCVRECKHAGLQCADVSREQAIKRF